jgi:DNA-binding transcriptional ArsR family regulator
MGAWDDADEAEQQRRARALASPLRMRILRLCLHESHTNRELAAELDVNPGTLLHHVRCLVSTGFLVAEEPRVGARGAREIPYRATGRSWRSGGDDLGPTLVQTFLQEIEGLAPEEIQITRLGLKLNEANRREMLERFFALFVEYKDRGADPDGEPISLMFAEHPEKPRAERTGGANQPSR